MITELNPQEDFEVDTNNLDEEFRKLPRYMNEYSSLYAQATQAHSDAKAYHKEVVAIVKKEVIATSDKKPADSILEMESTTHPTVIQAAVKVREAERDMLTIKGHCESMRAKKDMLIQLGANARKEVE